jgi:hypothetical protein
MQVKNAPIPAVLLTCSRMHDEYLEVSCFDKLDVDIDAQFNHFAEPCNEEKERPLRDQTIARIQCATIFIRHFRSLFVDVGYFVEQDLLPSALNIATLRIAISVQNRAVTDDDVWRNLSVLSVESALDPLIFPGLALAGLPLNNAPRASVWALAGEGRNLRPQTRTFN